MIKNCPKCGIEFESISKWGDERKFCSRKCANSKIMKEEQKQKLSFLMSGKVSVTKGKKKINGKWIINENIIEYKNCRFCGQELVKKRSKQFCNNTCANRFKASKGYSEEFREKQSQLVKDQYKNGRKKYGGHHHVPWYDYKNIRVQGTYELRMCAILDKWLEKGLIKNWEYTNDRVQYIGLDNKYHTYLIDFKILKNNLEMVYIEVKGKVTETDLLKWEVVRSKNQLLVVELKDLKVFENKIWKIANIGVHLDLKSSAAVKRAGSNPGSSAKIAD
jgi:hypothetical protein